MITRPSFQIAVQTRVTSLADEKLTRLCDGLGISKADVLRLVILRLVQGDIDVKAALRFRSLEEAEKEMRLLRRSKGEELL